MRGVDVVDCGVVFSMTEKEFEALKAGWPSEIRDLYFSAIDVGLSANSGGHSGYFTWSALCDAIHVCIQEYGEDVFNKNPKWLETDG